MATASEKTTRERGGEESSRPAAESAGSRPLAAAVLAWLVPGAGHLFLGRRARAALFAVLVVTMFAIGIALEGRLHDVVAGRPLSWAASFGSMGSGVLYLGLRFVAGYEGDVAGAGFEYGTAFLLTAGLMNLLLVLDAWDIAHGRKD